MANDDGDNIESKLRPAERHILEYAKTHPDLSFCWREFSPKFAHGTIRNALSTLSRLKLIELYCRSTDAYYIYRLPNSKQPRKPVTISHMGGKYDAKRLQINLSDFLESLEWEEISKVHDIVLCFTVSGLYERTLKEGKLPLIEQSKDIQFATFEWSNNRALKAILHRTETVTCYLKCSECPIEATPEGLVALSSFLGRVQAHLADAMGIPITKQQEDTIPDVSSWIVNQWHYGKDGKKEFSGQSLNLTYKTWSGALIRIYMKKHGEKYRARQETIETPKKKLPQAFTEKMNPDEKQPPEEPDAGPRKC